MIISNWRLLYRSGCHSRGWKSLCSIRAIPASSESTDPDCAENILQWSLDSCIIIQSSTRNSSQRMCPSALPWSHSDLILDACQEFRDIMAELTENLRLQSLRFIVRYSPTEDEDDEFGDFRMEDDPYPHLYDATRLLLERCPELRHLYLQSGKFENVSEEELSSMVPRNCPQLDTFVYDNHQKPLFGYTDLDAGRRYQNMCVITNSRLVNGFVSILQHLRNNLKVLRLTSDGIRGASWKTLKDLGGFPHLTLAHPRNVRLQRHP